MPGQSETAHTTRHPVPPWLAEKPVDKLISVLANADGCPRFVGGCVRDLLLGRAVVDLDVATVLKPETVQDVLFAANIKTVPTGIAHGTVTALLENRSVEVTTLRRDVETDGRHARVIFTSEWREDAARRDFTMNTLFMDPSGYIHDFFGGLADAKAGRVRFVGSPEDRIREDYLRILRFFRFQAHLGRVEPDCAALEACKSNAPRLEKLSGERLAKEFLRLLEAPDPTETLWLMHEAECLRPFFIDRTGVSRLSALSVATQSDPVLRLMALLPDDIDVLDAVIARLKLSSITASRIRQRVHGYRLDGPPVEEQLYRNGAQAVLDSAIIQSAVNREDSVLARVVQQARSWSAPTFPLKGQDLLDQGMQPGPQVGSLLDSVETWWLHKKFMPDREACLAKAIQLMK